MFGEYLEHSIRYYILDSPVVGDGYFDELCQVLLANWGNFNHRYKSLCDESALTAGSGFQIKSEDVPQIVLLCRKHNRPLKEVFADERRRLSLPSQHPQPEGS